MWQEVHFIFNLCLMQCLGIVCSLQKVFPSFFRNKLTFFVRLGGHQFWPQEDFHGQLVKMDEMDIRTSSFLVSRGKGFPMRNMRDELTFDPGLGQNGHNGSSKVAGYFNIWHNVAQISSSRWTCQNVWLGELRIPGLFVQIGKINRLPGTKLS